MAIHNEKCLDTNMWTGQGIMGKMLEEIRTELIGPDPTPLPALPAFKSRTSRKSHETGHMASSTGKGKKQLKSVRKAGMSSQSRVSTPPLQTLQTYHPIESLLKLANPTGIKVHKTVKLLLPNMAMHLSIQQTLWKSMHIPCPQTPPPVHHPVVVKKQMNLRSTTSKFTRRVLTCSLSGNFLGPSNQVLHYLIMSSGTMLEKW